MSVIFLIFLLCNFYFTASSADYWTCSALAESYHKGPSQEYYFHEHTRCCWANFVLAIKISLIKIRNILTNKSKTNQLWFTNVIWWWQEEVAILKRLVDNRESTLYRKLFIDCNMYVWGFVFCHENYLIYYNFRCSSNRPGHFFILVGGKYSVVWKKKPV